MISSFLALSASFLQFLLSSFFGRLFLDFAMPCIMWSPQQELLAQAPRGCLSTTSSQTSIYTSSAHQCTLECLFPNVFYILYLPQRLRREERRRGKQSEARNTTARDAAEAEAAANAAAIILLKLITAPGRRVVASSTMRGRSRWSQRIP